MAQEKKTLTNDELSGRVIVLEALAVAALGGTMRFGRAQLSPELIVLILDGVKSIVQRRLASPEEHVSDSGRREADRYLDYVLSHISEELIPRPRNQGPQTDHDKD